MSGQELAGVQGQYLHRHHLQAPCRCRQLSWAGISRHSAASCQRRQLTISSAGKHRAQRPRAHLADGLRCRAKTSETATQEPLRDPVPATSLQVYTQPPLLSALDPCRLGFPQLCSLRSEARSVFLAMEHSEDMTFWSIPVFCDG